MVRIVGVSGSPRHGNTELLIQAALRAAEEAPFDVETKLVGLAGKRIEPCTDCQVCASQARPCIKQDDWAEVASNVLDPIPDGLIIGSPVYFFSTTSLLRAFFERCTSLIKGLWVDDFPTPPPDLTRTAAAALAVGYHRHGGVEHAIASILHWMLTMGCACTGVDYIGASAWQRLDGFDTVKDDTIGLRNARSAGRRVAYLAHLLHLGGEQAAERLPAILEYRHTEEPHELNPG